MSKLSNKFLCAIWAMLLNLHASSHAQTYWLEKIEAPRKISKDGPFPYVSDPRDLGYLTTITLNGEDILMNGSDGCGRKIRRSAEFTIDKTLADTIDNAGGKVKFDGFLAKNYRQT